MKRAVIAALAFPVGVAACERAPAAPEPGPVEASLARAGTMSLTTGRRMDLLAAVADLRTRVLPAVASAGTEPAALDAALQRLDESLASGDRAGVLEAASAAELAMEGLPADQAGLLMAELDVVRLALGELRVSAGTRAVIE